MRFGLCAIIVHGNDDIVLLTSEILIRDNGNDNSTVWLYRCPCITAFMKQKGLWERRNEAVMNRI